jgi:hypothetical protein
MTFVCRMPLRYKKAALMRAAYQVQRVLVPWFSA